MSFLAMEACPRIPVVMVMFFRTTIIWLSLCCTIVVTILVMKGL